MRNWVKPLLIEKEERSMDEMNAPDDWRKLNLDRLNENLYVDDFVWSRLSEFLNRHFGIFGLCGDWQYFEGLFGSVLSDLPKEVFLRLCEMKNVFYIFTPNPGAEVKHLLFDDCFHENNYDRVIVVTFPYNMRKMNSAVARGTIVHELVHVHSHTDQAASNDEMEEEADRIAMGWGFEAEIKAMREYEKNELDNWKTEKVSLCHLPAANYREEKGGEFMPS